MKHKSLIQRILLTILLMLPIMVHCVEVEEGELEIFNELDIELISNEGFAYYCEFILDQINLLALSANDKSTMSNMLQETIGYAEEYEYELLVNSISNNLIPFAETKIQNDDQKEMIIDLLEIQNYVYNMDVDYTGIPSDFESNVIDHLNDEENYCFIGITIHFSGCFTVNNTHIKDCSKVTVGITLKDES